VLDAFLWRFGNPFYRESLGRLYLEPAAPAMAPAATQPAAGRRRIWSIALGAAALAGVAAVSFASFRNPGAPSLGAALANPIHAKNHLRWGLELAERGDFSAARRHLNEALARDPNSRDAKNALQWLESRRETARASEL